MLQARVKTALEIVKSNSCVCVCLKSAVCEGLLTLPGFCAQEVNRVYPGDFISTAIIVILISASSGSWAHGESSVTACQVWTRPLQTHSLAHKRP